jgi:hypothetical protein
MLELWPPAETAESRRQRETVLDTLRRRAARLSLPMPEDIPVQESRIPGNLLVRFDEGRVGRTSVSPFGVALSPTLPRNRKIPVVDRVAPNR